MRFPKSFPLILLAVLSTGCTQQAPRSEEVDSSQLQLPAHLAISEKQLDEPLTEDEVLCFLELVSHFPSGKLPEFSPVPSSEMPAAETPEGVARSARQSIRESLTVQTLLKGWSPHTSVRRILRDEQIEPQAMVSLMLRLSCAVAAEAIGTPRDIRAQQVIAEKKVDSLIERMYQLERTGQPVTEMLSDALRENAALAEYLAMLSEVPAESQQLVQEHRARLEQVIPRSEHAQHPAETRQESQIAPVKFESIERTPPASRSRR